MANNEYTIKSKAGCTNAFLMCINEVMEKDKLVNLKYIVVENSGNPGDFIISANYKERHVNEFLTIELHPPMYISEFKEIAEHVHAWILLIKPEKINGQHTRG